ncbi:hypothetical protein PC118_g17658 [Phytophthora cactorum]|uniref:PiggyBac transposable element-derived protein 4 C-terminal zinc-ribbon domain-containing protein n=1 Tax=Phytophthora cactorum TaxID=29920 RepID=A0A8T1FHA9_9STRA|nr:hypothetical protein PC118_g17658 [Phytophthora cactorum]
MTRNEFLTELQERTVQLTAAEFDAAAKVKQYCAAVTGDAPWPQSARNGEEHVPLENPDFHKTFHKTATGENKRCQRACKLCSRVRLYIARATGNPPTCGKNIKWYCGPCSDGNKRVSGPQPKMTCYQVYHEDWDCGRDIPLEYQETRTQMRALGEKRKRTRKDDDAHEGDEEEGSAHE